MESAKENKFKALGVTQSYGRWKENSYDEEPLLRWHNLVGEWCKADKLCLIVIYYGAFLIRADASFEKTKPEFHDGWFVLHALKFKNFDMKNRRSWAWHLCCSVLFEDYKYSYEH